MIRDVVGNKDSIDRRFCPKCTSYIESICYNMSSNQAEWFRNCAAEIKRHDGHHQPICTPAAAVAKTINHQQ
jgi:hypothetical protein